MSSRRRFLHLAAASLFLSRLTLLLSASSGVNWKKKRNKLSVWSLIQITFSLFNFFSLLTKSQYFYLEQSQCSRKIKIQKSNSYHPITALIYRFITCAATATRLTHWARRIRARRGEATSSRKTCARQVIRIQGNRLRHGAGARGALPWCHRWDESRLHHPLQILAGGDGRHCGHKWAGHVHPCRCASWKSTHTYPTSGGNTLLENKNINSLKPWAFL